MDRTIQLNKVWCLTVAMISICQMLFGQCATLYQSLEKRTEESAVIIEGKVVKQEAFYGEKNGLIYTNNLIEVYKVFKGNVETSTLELVTTGGILGNEALIVYPSLQLNPGQYGIFLLKVYAGNKIDSRKNRILRPVADGYSLLAYDPYLEMVSDGHKKRYPGLEEVYRELEQLTGEKYAIRKVFPANENKNLEMTPSITSFTPTTANGGKSETITITGTDFGTPAGTVFFDDPDDGSGGNFTSTIAWHITSWTNTQIVVRVPATAGTGKILVRDNLGNLSAQSSQTLTVNYAQTNIIDMGTVYEPQLIDEGADGDGGYQFNYSTSTANNGVDITSISAATDALERAADSWQTDTSMPFFLGTDCGTVSTQLPNNSTGSPVDDGTNLITFDSDIWDLDTEHSSSTLAVLYSMYGFCNSTDWEVTDMDMVIRRDGGGVTWEYGPATPSGGETDFESVVLHELGHAAQLKHTNNTGGVMFATISTGFSNRTLGTNDEVAGGSYVITHSITYNPPIESCSGDFMSSRDALAYNSSNECMAPLPVELLFFDARIQEKVVLLNWQTTSETDNDFFTLERSQNGRDYKYLTSLPGAGTTYDSKSYRFVDNQPRGGLNYYRLSQTDFDGRTEYLGVEVENFQPEALSIWLEQNPVVEEKIQLRVENPEDGIMELALYDLKGAIIKTSSAFITAGITEVNMDISTLPKGMFLLKTTLGAESKSFRLLKN